MSDLLLWKVLTPNDHNAMHAKAKQSSSGGGAMHIALGVDRTAFPIKSFLNTAKANKTIKTEPWPRHFGAGRLTFDGNPRRRGGEWRITDQAHHRHPAWSINAGFPKVFNPGDRPVVFIVRCQGKFYPTFLLEHQLTAGSGQLGSLVASKEKGVVVLAANWAKDLGITNLDSNLSRYKKAVRKALKTDTSSFIPDSLEDARKKTIREIVRRQGQQAFRKKLLKSYGDCCAISGCDIEEALEAAHISPYRGDHTNHVTNGILLRADLHTLFDLGLITVTPINHRVRVSSLLKPPHYQNFADVQIKEPIDGLSDRALEEHGKLFVA